MRKMIKLRRTHRLPSVEEAGVMAVNLSETVEPKLKEQEQAFFIAGFCECIKWIENGKSKN